MEHSFGKDYVVNEVKSGQKKNKNLVRELRDDLEKLVEKQTIDREYEHYLRKILAKAEKDEQNRRKKNKVTVVDRKDECDGDQNVVRAQSSKKRAQRKISNVKAESSIARINLEKEGHENNSDVEILDSAAILNKGNQTTFVPNTRFLNCMEDDDSEQPASPSGCDGRFRKQVLDVLTKPFDKEELKRLRKAVKEGSYRRHYPDFVSKLARHRYEREKCLTILRGFFFWLQNVSQEGSFKPWKDGQCLAVVPGSPGVSHLDHAGSKQSKRKIVK